MKTFGAIAVAVAIATFAPVSRAQPPPTGAPAWSTDNAKEAENHFRRGLEMYKEGDAGGALVEFKRAYELAPNYRALFNIGETYFQLQRYADALKTLQAFLNAGGAQIPSDKRAAVESEMRQLQSRIGQVDVKVNVDGAQILVDDEPVGMSPLAQPAVVSVGHRKIVVIKSGLPTQERFVDIAAGDHATVSVELSPVEPAIAQAPAAPAAAPADAVGQRATPASHTGALIAWGVAGAFGAATAITGVLTLSAKGDLTNQLGTFPGNASSINGARDKVRNLGILTDALTGATALATGVAIYVSLAGHSHPASAEVGVGPSAVVLRGRF
jgi:hypothetical protein